MSRDPFLTPYGDSLLIGWSRLQVHPGTYHLAVEFLDENNGKMGRWLKEINVEDFGDQNLSMSDVVLAWEIGDFQEQAELRRGYLRILPNTSETYLVYSSIPLYFEVYNLTYSPEGNTHYRITYTVQPEEKAGRIDRFIGKLLGSEDQSGKVITSYEYNGSQRFESIHQNLSLENPSSQQYHISVEVEDLNTGGKAVREKAVVLKESKE